MSAFKRIFMIVSFGVYLLPGTSKAEACDVPVFLYALEKWRPDTYFVEIHHDAPLTEEELQIVEWLEQNSAKSDRSSNYELQRIDSGSSSGLTTASGSSDSPSKAMPMMAVGYSDGAEFQEIIWTAPLTWTAAKALVDSPVRREIFRLLADGGSIVWLLLESGNAERDDACAQTIREHCDRLKDKVQASLETNYPDLYRQSSQKEGGLSVSFPLLRLARNNEAERGTIRLILQNKDIDPADVSEPIAFPIFGRGRMLLPLEGDDISESSIDEVISFLWGPCLCTVKGAVPGRDLLMLADWESTVPEKYSDMALSSPFVSLSGLSQEPEAKGNEPDIQAVMREERPNRIMRNTIIAASAVVAIALLSTIALRSRKRSA